jgi:hypothetical protein
MKKTYTLDLEDIIQIHFTSYSSDINVISFNDNRVPAGFEVKGLRPLDGRFFVRTDKTYEITHKNRAYVFEPTQTQEFICVGSST